MENNKKAPVIEETESSSSTATKQDLTTSDVDSVEALRVGQLILTIRDIIDNPGLPDAMETIVELGTDSRYYVLVRGWLREQLQADESILDATKHNAPTNIIERVAFLNQAIRFIDLE